MINALKITAICRAEFATKLRVKTTNCWAYVSCPQKRNTHWIEGCDNMNEEMPSVEKYEAAPDEQHVEITDELRKYSGTRTGRHIARVIAFGQKIGFNFEQHDHTKFSAELIEPYILIDNAYRKDLDPPVPYTKVMAEAAFKHIKAEPHHPEYWDETASMNYDGGLHSSDTIATVDASGMSVPAICEMVCDWCAMSVELESSPVEWATKNIGVRWNFTDDQEELIFLLIRVLWTPENIEDVKIAAKSEPDQQDSSEEKPGQFKVLTDNPYQQGRDWTVVSREEQGL